MNKRQSAAIPYRRSRENIEVLLVTSRKRGRWVLPKGTVKRGMVSHMAAAMEAFEEAGALGSVERLPIGEYRQRKVTPGGRRTEIAVLAFALEVNTLLRSWPEMRIRQRRWLALDKAVRLVNDAEIQAILRAFAADLESR